MRKIYKHYFILAITLILLTQTTIFSQTNSFDPKTLSPNGQTAYQDLLETKTFTFAGFGAVAAEFRSTTSLKVLLKEKSAEKALQSVVKNANPEGQVYALIGLQSIKSNSFKAYFEDFKQNLIKNKINEISSEDGGCDSSSLSLKSNEVIKKIESNEYVEHFVTWVQPR